MISTIDFIVIACYLGAILTIGLLFRKKASQGKDAYFMGNRTIPWYRLGLSNATGMFDISGTMWLVTLTFAYGLKSIWIPWLWPVFNQIFLMVYLSKWLRRSNVLTGAEWIYFRFGKGSGGKQSHAIVVLFAIISCIGFLAYGFIGFGKFMAILIPWDTVSSFLPFTLPENYAPHFYGIVISLFAVFYSVLGGMSGIVWTDMIQYSIMVITSIIVAILAWNAMAIQTLQVPQSWHDPFFGFKLDLDWSGIIDGVNAKIASDGFSLFGIFFTLMLFKGLLASVAGPAPNYDMQKILAARSPGEAAKMSGLVSLALIPVRYLMVGGFAILGLLYYDRLNLDTGQGIDFENILPSAIANFVPVGFVGLFLAALLAAFMSTFAATLNAAQAYVVNDIYPKFVPKATNSQVRRASYITGVTVVAISILLCFFIQDVNGIVQWIVSALWGGYLMANILKWHWWRFNGQGYFMGMLFGIVPAIILPLVFETTLELYLFPGLLAISAIGCIIGTYSAPPTGMATLKNFYSKTRPWGLWKPVYQELIAELPDFKRNTSFSKDALNVGIGIIAQTLLVAVPLYLLLHRYSEMVFCLILLGTCGIWLKYRWWDRLDAD